MLWQTRCRSIIQNFCKWPRYGATWPSRRKQESGIRTAHDTRPPVYAITLQRYFWTTRRHAHPPNTPSRILGRISVLLSVAHLPAHGIDVIADSIDDFSELLFRDSQNLAPVFGLGGLTEIDARARPRAAGRVTFHSEALASVTSETLRSRHKLRAHGHSDGTSDRRSICHGNGQNEAGVNFATILADFLIGFFWPAHFRPRRQSLRLRCVIGRERECMTASRARSGRPRTRTSPKSQAARTWCRAGDARRRATPRFRRRPLGEWSGAARAAEADRTRS